MVEGLELRDADGELISFSVQYHPEAAAGPHDASYLFDRFVRAMSSREGWSLMPKRTDISSILVIGSGPIVIGQACEFDYSGTQACRVLREEGFRVILVNSNPATIMTDPEFADATYIEPITPEFVELVIAKERPDALLATLGGQTALNAAVALHENGVLEKYGVELIGASIEAIQRGENREQFKAIVREPRAGPDLLGPRRRPTPDVGVARSLICHSMDDVLAAAAELGYPLVVRPSFTMGGVGSGFAHDEDELRRIAGAGLAASPTTEVLIEESILGWKEYELEVMRDRADNVVIVCSIENFDPMGVHTGDSITVAPAMTLTDREYQRMRDVSIAIIRAVGVDTGGCNIQFAIDPATGRMIVIEMNPRVSRSSALASKATGFPIAKIAAKVAIGYTLDEIPNDITQVTPASFEPTLDYVIVKVPRFAFEKFPAAEDTLTTHMKSVGEAMGIGRNFTEALGKALRSLEDPKAPFDWVRPVSPADVEELLDRGRRARTTAGCRSSCRRCGPAPPPSRCTRRPRSIPGSSTSWCCCWRWPTEVETATELTPALLRTAKRHGFSDAQIAALRHLREDVVRGVRWALGHPAGLQDGGHLRRGVRRPDAVPLQLLRRRDRGRAADPAGGADPGQRPEPDRAGDRVRLLLRARGDGPLRCSGQRWRRLRDDHGQLQPGDRLHRLRHRRPALLRAADAGGRARDLPRRGGRRTDRRRGRAARRSDPAAAGPGPQGRRRADRRHQPGGHPPGRGAGRVRPGAGRGRTCPPPSTGWPAPSPRRSGSPR